MCMCELFQPMATPARPADVPISVCWSPQPLSTPAHARWTLSCRATGSAARRTAALDTSTATLRTRSASLPSWSVTGCRNVWEGRMRPNVVRLFPVWAVIPRQRFSLKSYEMTSFTNWCMEQSLSQEGRAFVWWVRVIINYVPSSNIILL